MDAVSHPLKMEARFGKCAMSYLGYAKSSPFFLPQQLEGSLGGVMVLFGNSLEHGFGELNMTVFIFTVGVPGRVVDGVDKLFYAGALRV